MIVAGQPAEVQLADRHDAVAALAQSVVPARNGAFVGVGVVPVADLVTYLPVAKARAPARRSGRSYTRR